LIGQHLEAVRGAIWRAALIKNSLALLAFLTTVALVFVIVDQWVYSFSMPARLLVAFVTLAASVYWVVRAIVPLIRLRISPEYAAYSVELDQPDLKHALTSYVTLRNERDTPGLRGIVVRSIGVRAARHLRATGLTMPTAALGNFRPGVTTAVLLASLILYAVLSPKNTVQSFSRLAAPLADIRPPTRVSILEVTPGNTDSLFGRPLAIEARVTGLSGDEQPRVSISGAASRTLQMIAADSPGRFAVDIPSDVVRENFRYQVIAGDDSSELFDVVVRDEPTVNVEQVRYAPQPYTRLPSRTSSGGAVEGLEGTRVTVVARANRPINRGRIEFNPREVNGEISATAGIAPLEISDDGMTISAAWNLRSGRRSEGQIVIDSYRLRVWDKADTPNADPIEFPIRVTADLAPEIVIAVPETWPKDVPLGSQQLIEVRAIDPDFGLAEVQLRLRRGTRLMQTTTLLQADPAVRGNQVALFRFRPDAMKLMSGDLVAVTAIASDNRRSIDGDRPDPNVTVSSPIELRITDAVPGNAPLDDGDGLQPKDDQPESGEREGEPGEGKSEQGESGQGESGQGESGQGESGQGDSGRGDGCRLIFEMTATASGMPGAPITMPG
jgi:hypothetical protein